MMVSSEHKSKKKVGKRRRLARVQFSLPAFYNGSHSLLLLVAFVTQNRDTLKNVLRIRRHVYMFNLLWCVDWGWTSFCMTSFSQFPSSSVARSSEFCTVSYISFQFQDNSTTHEAAQQQLLVVVVMPLQVVLSLVAGQTMKRRKWKSKRKELYLWMNGHCIFHSYSVLQELLPHTCDDFLRFWYNGNIITSNCWTIDRMKTFSKCSPRATEWNTHTKNNKQKK